MNLTALTEKVVELEDEMVTRIVERALDLGAAPEIVNAVNDGLDKVGLLYERGEYSISDLMMAGVIFEDILNMEDAVSGKPAGRGFCRYNLAGNH